MIAVPQSTVEKPLTVIDYIAVLDQCGDITMLSKFAAALPPHIVEDDRFAKAVKSRLDAIKEKGKP